MTHPAASGNVTAAPVAQLAELSTFNRDVVGSNPTGGTFRVSALPARMVSKITVELAPVAIDARRRVTKSTP